MFYLQYLIVFVECFIDVNGLRVTAEMNVFGVFPVLRIEKLEGRKPLTVSVNTQ